MYVVSEALTVGTSKTRDKIKWCSIIASDCERDGSEFDPSLRINNLYSLALDTSQSAALRPATQPSCFQCEVLQFN